jgi:protein phosphatase
MGRTDPGARTNNEDAFAIIDRHHLFVIADSVGRHAAGGVASQLAVDAIAASFDDPDAGASIADDPKLPRRANQLRRAVLGANGKIFERARDKPEHAGMGTTVIAAYFAPDNQRVYIGRVGDSRCYRVRSGSITLMTKEHVPGAVGPRALGVEAGVDVEIVVMAPEAGDVYLLCSDALSRAVKETALLSLVTLAPTLEAATTTLVDAAKAGGGRDDITTILVRVDEPKKR